MNEYLVMATIGALYVVSVWAIFYATQNARKAAEELLAHSKELLDHSRKVVADLLDVVLRLSTGMERIGQSVIAYKASTDMKNPAAGPAIVGTAARLDPLTDKPQKIAPPLSGTRIKAGR